MKKLSESEQLIIALQALQHIHEKGCRNCGSYSVYNIADRALKQIQQLPTEHLSTKYLSTEQAPTEK